MREQNIGENKNENKKFETQNWAEPTGLEPAASCVTGRRSNQTELRLRVEELQLYTVFVNYPNITFFFYEKSSLKAKNS